MKFGLVALCFNEEDILKGFLDGWDLEYKVIIILNKTFQGNYIKHDKSEKIALRKGAIVIRCNEMDQYEARNIGIALLQGLGVDYAFVKDCDELIEKDTLNRYKRFIEENPVDLYYAKQVILIKKPNYHAISPHDKGGFTCMKTDVRIDKNDPHFCENKDISKEYIPVEELGNIYHLKFVRSPRRMKLKLKNSRHADELRENWYKEVFEKFDPSMENFGPYRPTDYVSCEVIKLPKEIKNRIPRNLW